MRRKVAVRDDELVEVTLLMTKEESRALSRILRKALEAGWLKGQPSYRWKELYRTINNHVQWPVMRTWGNPERPSDDYGPNHLDMDHVVNGRPPFPVLSVADMYEVYPQLEDKGLSAAQIAARLYVCERTVVRWRKREREKGNGR